MVYQGGRQWVVAFRGLWRDSIQRGEPAFQETGPTVGLGLEEPHSNLAF